MLRPALPGVNGAGGANAEMLQAGGSAVRIGRGRSAGRPDQRVLVRLIEAAGSDIVAQSELRHRRRGDQVRNAGADVRRIVVVRAVGEGEAERIAGIDGLNPGKIVTADDVVQETSLVPEVPAFAHRQLIGETGNKAVPQVKAGSPFVQVAKIAFCRAGLPAPKFAAKALIFQLPPDPRPPSPHKRP